MPEDNETEARTPRNTPSVGFVTFGCRLNKAESIDLKAQYAAKGWRIMDMRSASAKAAPDLIVVRGCSVTAKAQRDCEKAIAHLRTRFPATEIRITGCLPDEGNGEWGMGNGGGEMSDVCEPISRRGAERQRAQSCLHDSAGNGEGILALTSNLQGLSRAYLKVQDGCSGRCAFCIVPSFRGPPRSIPFRVALDRARAFLAAGYREIILTGCNLCLYRSDGRGLPALTAAIAELDSPGHRVRIGSLEPGICDAAIIDALEAHPNICRFLHLSLQSGSDRILKAMRRPYTARQVADMCDEARRRIGARLAFGADVISGFPGETAADHKATLELIRATGVVHVHAFPYSERPGTEAAEMTGAVPVAERRRRAKEVERAGAANRAAFAEALVGEAVEVCVERDGNGRTGENLRCILNGKAARRSIVLATVEKYFHKSGAISATIRAMDSKEEKQ